MDEQDYDSKIDKYTKEKLAKDRQLLEEEKELKIKWRNEIDQNEQLQLYLSNYQKNRQRILLFIISTKSIKSTAMVICIFK